MSRRYESQRRQDGFYYEFLLPDDWVTMNENDGEREFIVHKSPSGSSLYIRVSQDMKVHWRSRIPREITDSLQQVVYAAADMDECLAPAVGMGAWIGRSLMHAMGRRPKLKSELLGTLQGFSYWVKRRGDLSWRSYLACQRWIVHSRFEIERSEQLTEVNAVRDILSSFRFVNGISEKAVS